MDNTIDLRTAVALAQHKEKQLFTDTTLSAQPIQCFKQWEGVL